MKKKLTIMLLMVLFCSVAFAAQFHTVPLDDSSYRIIEVAQVKGIIPLQSKVKPYTLNTVINLLETIKGSGQIDEDELDFVESTIKRLETKYGTSKISGASDVAKNGQYRTELSENGFGFAIGVKGSITAKVGMNNSKDKILDTRNTAVAYIMGDLGNVASFDMNFGFAVDMIDPYAYVLTDMPVTSHGQYFLGGLNDVWSFYNSDNDNRKVGIGLTTYPEITASFYDGKLAFQFGSFKRDWGPGMNNILLSGSAEPMDGFQLDIEPVKWFHFSVLNAATSQNAFYSINGVTLPTDGIEHETKGYNNNFSIQRLEFNFKNMNVSIYESVVWGKRFELGYLNPFGLYWITQNLKGDYDSLIGGIDVSLYVADKLQFYIGGAVDEFSTDLAHFFTHPRNLILWQAGLKVPTPYGNFSELTLQGTYVPSFFGNHKLITDEKCSWGPTIPAYVNMGKSIYYPLNPDSIEGLIDYSIDFNNKLSMKVNVKDQICSAQYAIDPENGNTIAYSVDSADGQEIYYNNNLDYQQIENYAMRDFFHNIWRNLLDINVDFTFKLEEAPVSITAGAELIFDWKRPYTVDKYGHTTNTNKFSTPEITALGKVAVKVYY